MVNKSINNTQSRMDGFGGGPNLSRKAMTIIVVATVIILAGIVWLCSFLHPLPPHTVVMATGPEGSSYNYFGKRYQQLMAKEGIKVILVPTAGGVENLAKLRDPKSGVEIGLVEGGIADDSDSPALVSLGTICYEPMWLFSRKPTTDRVLFALEGKRVSVGPEGSDSRALVDELLKGRQLNTKSFEALPLSPEDTVSGMLNGTIDAAILMSSPSSPVVKK
ncbi:MAG TPA: TAXI family TRAP transporter solute-binding subunit, partial [bacterium]|nr:TAXI family TRAP transporter solute-binding subunit [bacterium]